MSDLHWYPGHMTKAVRQMKEDIKLIDIVIEILDARIPLSSRNPDIDTLANGKLRVIILNKADMSDVYATEGWVEYFNKKGFTAVKLNSIKGDGIKQVKDAIMQVAEDKISRDRKRGILLRPVRALVAGIPNVGKSTFINTFVGRSVAKTGNKPGVTRGKQWLRLNKKVELLDTPGILWPKFEDKKTAEHLAFVGSIKEDIIEKNTLATKLLLEIKEIYADNIYEYYKIEPVKEDVIPFSEKVLELVAKKRGLVKKGGELDVDKAVNLILDDFKNGRLGRITLEKVEENSYEKKAIQTK